MRVLVVDDDEATTKALAALLRLEGFEVESASSGEDALAHLSASRFDVLLTDIRMAHLDGIALLSSLGAKRPGLVIVISGLQKPQSRQAGALEFDLWIEKPVNVEEVVEAIRSRDRGRVDEPG